jgi:phenylacetate-CoA ligase
MLSFFHRLLLRLEIWKLAILHRVFITNKNLYIVLSTRELQPILERIGRLRAQSVFLRAQKRCPAYREFLAEQGYSDRRKWSLSDVPVMTKENYVKRYSIEQRCYGGSLPKAGVVIDESSGSTGQPNNWVRSAAERNDVKRLLQLNYELVYPKSGIVLLNCFALGPWATGMNVSISLVDAGILKSIGPDREKLENTIKLLGPKYHYLIFGYPPFIRSFVDDTELDLSAFHIDFVVGGEGISEELRTHLLRASKSVISSYGASDLEINIGIETELTIALRRICRERPDVSRLIFGRNTPPMIFQYNAATYVIETNEDKELLFTIGRQASAAPKVRYNLRDSGGVSPFRVLAERLRPLGIDLTKLVSRFSYFPFLFVYGRNDSSVPFYGCKVFPSDIEQIINGETSLAATIHSFQLQVLEDQQLISHLYIHLEKRRAAPMPLLPNEQLLKRIFEGLIRVNQDFREVTRMFQPGQVKVFVHEYETGPFASRDIRVKNNYVAN